MEFKRSIGEQARGRLDSQYDQGIAYLRRCFARLVHRRRLSVALAGIIAFGMSAALSSLHVPEPETHDEFSYLLAADTFAHGRLTNPRHPMWVHFESFHIIHQPTYQSKYPPAQGLMLAVGQVIAGHPIVGVWISVGLASAAICWMLWAWFPPRWALLGGLAAALHPGILGHWSQSYWGGAIAMMGGALLFGSLRRIVHKPRMRDALLMGLGLAVLASSRPFEGLVVSLPVAAVLLAWMVSKKGPPGRVSIVRIAVPVLAVLGIGAGAMGLYNLRVTGSAFHLPYQVYVATYAAPLFLQHSDPEMVYRHKPMGDYYSRWINKILRGRSAKTLAYERLKEILELGKFYLGLGPLVSLIVQFEMLPWALRRMWAPFLLLTYGVLMLASLRWGLRDVWMRLALLTCGILAAVYLFGKIVVNPHYLAPLAGLVFALQLQAVRHLCLWRWHGRVAGRFIVRAVLLIFVVSVVLLFDQQTRAHPKSWHLQRARMQNQLKKNGGYHLLIVRYEPEHNFHNEWVYNEADIDSAKVVWARDMGDAQNQELLRYFKDREIWLIEPDNDPPKLSPYPITTSLLPGDPAQELPWP